MTDPDDYRDLTVTATMTETTARYKFGDRVEMIAASHDNPHKYGFFIRKGRSAAFTNGGPYVELTDGKGNVWRTPPDNVRPAPATPTALSASPAGWRPIETAPRDGSAVLIWGANLNVPGEMAVAVRCDEHDDLELWDIHDGKHGPYRLRGPSPTHWMPLPPAPAAAPSAAPQEALTGFIAGLRKAAKQVAFYGPSAGEAVRELNAIADRWQRRGLDAEAVEELAEFGVAATPAAGEALTEAPKRSDVQFWRDDAFRAAAHIAERYGQTDVANDIRALAAARKE